MRPARTVLTRNSRHSHTAPDRPLAVDIAPATIRGLTPLTVVAMPESAHLAANIGTTARVYHVTPRASVSRRPVLYVRRAPIAPLPPMPKNTPKLLR